ncbi:MAG: VOC family protein [Bacillota bacterium]|nr:VOC family protein [Bacillota bacterium]
MNGEGSIRQTPLHGEVFLDHVGWFVSDALQGADAFERLGFVLTPLVLHRLDVPGVGLPQLAGTANRCAMLPAGYLECISAVGGQDTVLSRAHRAATARYVGVHLVAFSVSDARATHERLSASGFDPLDPAHLRRPLDPDGSEAEAAFTVIRVPPSLMPEGRIQFLVHETPELTWGDRASSGSNRLFRLSSVLICTEDPEAAAIRFGRFLGREPAIRSHGAWVHLDRGAVGFGSRHRCRRLLPGAYIPPPPSIAAVGLESEDLPFSMRHFADRGVRPTFANDSRFHLGSEVAAGTALVVHLPSHYWLSERE